MGASLFWSLPWVPHRIFLVSIPYMSPSPDLFVSIPYMSPSHFLFVSIPYMSPSPIFLFQSLTWVPRLTLSFWFNHIHEFFSLLLTFSYMSSLMSLLRFNHWNELLTFTFLFKLLAWAPHLIFFVSVPYMSSSSSLFVSTLCTSSAIYFLGFWICLVTLVCSSKSLCMRYTMFACCLVLLRFVIIL